MLARQAKNSIKKNHELLNAISSESYASIESILSNATKNLTAQFRAFMNGATILPYKNLSIRNLFNDYFQNNPPFENNKEKKAEFPDAVVIMCIKNYLKTKQCETMHIVTDDNGWHDAFRGIDSVHMYKELKAFLTEISKEEILYKKVAQYAGTCIETLKNSVENHFSDYDWSYALDNIDICIECDDVEGATIYGVELIPDGIEYIDKEDGYAVASFSGTAFFNINFSYIDHTNEIYDREDHVWFNTIYGSGTARISIPFTSSATILIDDNGKLELNSHSFDTMDFGDAELLEYELTPYREDDEPFFNVCPDCGDPIGIHNDGGGGFCVNCAPNH